MSISNHAYTIVHTSGYHPHAQAQQCLIHVEDEISATFELIKIVQKADKHKWTLLVAPAQVPNKALLSSCVQNIERLMVMRPWQLKNAEQTLKTALANGNFSAVVLWPEQVEHEVVEQLLSQPQLTQTSLYAMCWQQAEINA